MAPSAPIRAWINHGKASGRFSQHDQPVIDADFAELPRWLRLAAT
jgi:hypothetical protein